MAPKKAPGARPLRVLVTGKPGVGKTTLCEAVHRQLREASHDAEGFLAAEQRENRQRVGFEIYSLNDRSKTAPLATVQGTGPTVGRYHVQLEAFESFTFPMLDSVLERQPDSGPRVFVFDEIGKMEMMSQGFVDRVRRLLSSPDPNLHVLGTVAVSGGQFIAESKRLAGVEVVEIDQLSRNAVRDEVAARFVSALSGGASAEGGSSGSGAAGTAAAAPPAPSGRRWGPGGASQKQQKKGPDEEASAAAATEEPAEAGEAAEAAESEPAEVWRGPRLRAAGGLVPPRARFDMPGEGCFSPIYEEEPEANFASVNAGDYLLYVGGAAINRAFREAMKACGQDPDDKYELLHELLLVRAGATPGQLQWLRREEAFPKPARAQLRQCKCSYCGQPNECWDVELRSLRGKFHCEKCWQEYEEWLFSDIVALCGLLPTGKQMQALSPVGLISLAVFPPGRRPGGDDRNMAMVYAVGPNCGNTRKKGRRAVDMLGPEEFLQVVETLGATMQQAVVTYNVQAPSRALPQVEILRICLLSGGVYKHPETSKVDVAAALISGLVAGGVANASGAVPAAAADAAGAPECASSAAGAAAGAASAAEAEAATGGTSAQGQSVATAGMPMPLLDFAFDEDAFRVAWDALGLGTSDAGKKPRLQA